MVAFLNSKRFSVDLPGIAHTYDQPTSTKLREILNSICYALADAYTAGGRVLEPQINVLTEDAIEEFIPRLVFNIAVKAGWIAFHQDPMEDLDWASKLGVGDYELPDESREIFLQFLSQALMPLRERALKDEEALQSKIDELNAKRDEWLQLVLNAPATGKKITRNAKALIDECISRSSEIATLKDFAFHASPYKRKLDGAGVSAASITRLCQGKLVARQTREAVAILLNKELNLDPPCSRDELLPASRK